MFKSWQNSIKITFLAIAFIHSSRANNSINAAQPRSCYSCDGVSCLRTSLTEVSSKCEDLLDICVTIFDEFAVVAKGCYLDIPERYRNKCDQGNNPECQKCFGDLCNNLGRSDFKCIQCKSKEDKNCASNTNSITPIQCSIPTAPNSYCYVRQSNGDVERGCLRHVKEQQECLKDGSCSMCLPGDGAACNSFQIEESGQESGATQNVATFSLSAGLALIIALLRQR